MSRFTSPTITRQPVPSPDTRTYEGGAATTLTPELEAFLLGTTFISGSFYERGNDRVARYAGLIGQLSQTNPEWVRSFLPWLRKDANIRTAAVVGAVEAARNGLGRQILPAVLSRPDEPAEALGYHMAVYGKRLPAAVKRGLADAATNLYTEFAAIKYAARGAAIQPADVIAMTHPIPSKFPGQGEVFTYLGDIRHGRTDPRVGTLMQVAEVRHWLANPRADWTPDGLTWELALSRGVEAGLDRRALWERLIAEGRLGYMALLRNLRNIEEADVSDAALKIVDERLRTGVEGTRVMPWRIMSAWGNSKLFGAALREAAAKSVELSFPEYPGRTLVLIDTSASMRRSISDKSTIRCIDVAAFYGAALRSTSAGADVWLYADTSIPLMEKPGGGRSPLATVDEIVGSIGVVGHGTETWPSLQTALASRSDVRYSRVVILTDMQSQPSNVGLPGLPIYVFDLAGYGKANLRPGPGRYLFSGVTDAQFAAPPMIERAEGKRWPWED